MIRSTRRLLAISSTVGVTLLLAWLLVQTLVIRPNIGEREQARSLQVLDAAESLRSGVSKKELEETRGIDVRIFHGPPEGPPEGGAWIRLETPSGTLWKREGGNYEIAAWTGQAWVALQEHFPRGATLALAFVAGGVPLVLLMFGLSQRASRHQERLEASLSRIAAGRLDERLDEAAGSREQRRMAVAVNQMADQLQRLIDSDRQKFAGLSHELRTPLTRIRLELELARRDGGPEARLDRVERDIEVFDGMLAEMLELSRLRSIGRGSMNREVVDLAGLARLVVDEDGWDDVEIRGSGTATVDPRLAGRLIRNLLHNSAQHAPGSQRWVEITADAVAVGDDGPGVPRDQQDIALQPFQRGASSQGHGLGLAIVAQIAELHGGSVALSEPPGLVVRVRFPPGTVVGPADG